MAMGASWGDKPVSVRGAAALTRRERGALGMLVYNMPERLCAQSVFRRNAPVARMAARSPDGASRHPGSTRGGDRPRIPQELNPGYGLDRAGQMRGRML